MQIYYSPKFLKQYRKLTLMIKEIMEEKEEIFRNDPFDQRLRTHKLKGKLEGYYAFSINNSYRIIFEFVGSNIEFSRVGKHDIYE